MQIRPIRVIRVLKTLRPSTCSPTFDFRLLTFDFYCNLYLYRMNFRLFIFIPFIILFTGIVAAKANHHTPSAMLFFKKADAIDNFWKWFHENQKRLRGFESDPEKYLAELLDRVKKIRRGLAIELELPNNGIINMTISADGVKELFPLVDSIVAKAPKIDGWKFIAFRQRLTKEQLTGVKVQAGPLQLDPSQMRFFPLVEKDKLDIIVYVKGITEDNYNHVAYGGLLLLDNLLGEYDCATKVRSYDFHDMPVKKEDLDGTLPLFELAAYIDKFHRK